MGERTTDVHAGGPVGQPLPRHVPGDMNVDLSARPCWSHRHHRADATVYSASRPGSRVGVGEPQIWSQSKIRERLRRGHNNAAGDLPRGRHDTRPTPPPGGRL
jgi:hypothetical protein